MLREKEINLSNKTRAALKEGVVVPKQLTKEGLIVCTENPMIRQPLGFVTTGGYSYVRGFGFGHAWVDRGLLEQLLALHAQLDVT